MVKTAPEGATRHWEVGLFTSCCERPHYFCVSCFFPWCCICKQRYDVYEGDMSRYECCGGAYCGGCHCFCGKACPELCLCLESIFCCWCAIFGNRFLIQSEYGIMNTKCENCLIWFMCILSWVRCIVSLFVNIPFEIEVLCDLLFCCFSACLQTQQEAEIVYQKEGPSTPSMKE
eukprot:TRINITY_DN64_c3_g1_i1.p1 TRINITY_DN64_c3_g1~~TRINITY_DN64_c3_g1_i1.p1  ORF type:complete len:174 (-),score=12.56 TRINITY_DN64_c3_g1_i1:15-536(-)